MKPKVIATKLSENTLDSKEKALKKMNFSSQSNCCLVLITGKQEEHLLWVGDDGHNLKIRPVFTYDYAPEDISKMDLFVIEAQSYFIYRKKLYFYAKSENEELISQISVFNICEEIKILYNIPNGINYICKAYRICDDKKASRKLIGICWRCLVNNYIYTLPFFFEDYQEIINIPKNEVCFECLEAGETFFHGGQIWTVYQQEYKNFYANPKNLKLSL